VKMKTILLFGLYAALAGAGMSVSFAQNITDRRCLDCETFFRACIYQCDLEGGEGCYGACIQQRRLCKATFCPP
jgi:hypothetical protein